MKKKELKELSPEELLKRSGELRLEMMNLRVQQASNQLENPARIRTVRREVARIETLLAERHRAAAPAAR